MNIPAPMASLHHISQQQQMQNNIRVMIESELARSRFSPRNSSPKNNMESAPGPQQDSAEFQLA